jgi:hypothetical protein
LFFTDLFHRFAYPIRRRVFILKGKQMKTIIVGSRTIDNYDIVKLVIQSCLSRTDKQVSMVVSGCAKGVDKLGEQWAKECNLPVKQFPAQWLKYGKAAGHIRNRAMADYADMLFVIWDGTSRVEQKE